VRKRRETAAVEKKKGSGSGGEEALLGILALVPGGNYRLVLVSRPVQAGPMGVHLAPVAVPGTK
jgi:hypothetical protein